MFAIQNSGLKFKKDGVNPHFKSAYMTLDGIMEVLQPILEEKKLLVYHQCIEHDTNVNYLHTVVEDMDSDTKVESAVMLQNLDAQKIGSQLTYFKRYNLGCLFNITVDEDDDGNATMSKAKKQGEEDNDLPF